MENLLFKIGEKVKCPEMYGSEYLFFIGVADGLDSLCYCKVLRGDSVVPVSVEKLKKA